MPVKIADVVKRMSEIENVRRELGKPTTIGMKKTHKGTTYISVRNMGEVYWLREDSIPAAKKPKVKAPKKKRAKPK